MSDERTTYRTGGPDERGRARSISPPRWPWLIVAFLLAYPFYWWFVKRVEVGPNELLVLVNKTGRELPPDVCEGSHLIRHHLENQIIECGPNHD